MNENKLFGIVTLADLENAISEQKVDLRVRDFCSKSVLTVYPDETLSEALRHFGTLEVGRMPVVDRGDPSRVIGMLRRNDIIHSLSTQLVNSQKISHHMERLKMETIVRAELTEFFINKGDAVCGMKLSELSLPNDCVIVSVQRGKKVVVPRGFTQLLAGDRVIALVDKNALDKMRSTFKNGPEITIAAPGSPDKTGAESIAIEPLPSEE